MLDPWGKFCSYCCHQPCKVYTCLVDVLFGVAVDNLTGGCCIFAVILVGIDCSVVVVVGSSVAVAEHVAGSFAVDCSVVVIVGFSVAVTDAEHVAGLFAVFVDFGSAADLRRGLPHLSTIVLLGPLGYLYGFVVRFGSDCVVDLDAGLKFARLTVGLFVVMDCINH